MIVTVVNGKGGVGKTTTALFTAHALARETGDRYVVLDTDPQGSAARWARLAAEAGTPLEVTVRACTATQLASFAAAVPNVVIDTPPGDADVMAAAVELADLVVVPTSPSALDVAVTRQTLDTVAAFGRPYIAMLTRTRRTKSVVGAESEILDAGAKLLSTHIPLREGLAMAFGRPIRELHGYDLAVAEILGYLPERPYSVEAVQARTQQQSPRRAATREWTSADDALIAQLRTSVARLSG